MKIGIAGIAAVMLVLFFAGCKTKRSVDSIERLSNHKLSAWNRKLTDVIITDVFSPPVCSRIYSYCNVASYEALVPAHTDYVSFAGRLNGLKQVPRPAVTIDSAYLPISSVIAFTTVAQKLLFNADAMKDMEDDYLKQLDEL